ncbi:FadR family transcriptional regulator [Lichenicola cladoniae]|uniref:FadR family transcriptional regulator n=1 Tax=Lichenicola cladoniae TaxID=1484109 RepID=A0A6M8HRH5_9PROT|nr:FadR/GntR family transcriptional regulator [Lichenicola cladoniae]NPD69070.1 FadR family transcriptional regulator [Acetobacteraceae bacterium]QKE90896.1 FadR family transcriptional regulator [Lichenicola cladoniae]
MDHSPAGPPEFVLQPGRRQRLGDQLYGQILEQIVSGRLREGERLPSELRICEMFGVSRPVVRAALSRLRADGLVQARQGAGTFVLHRPADRLTRFAEPGQIAQFLRCVEVRLPLEAAAARLAAERRQEADLVRIEAAQAVCRRELDEGSLRVEADLAFHAAVASASGNEMFTDMLHHIQGVLSGFMRLSLNLTRTGSTARAQAVLQEHAHIQYAIVSGDAEGAETAMRFHIGQARRRMTDRNRDL